MGKELLRALQEVAKNEAVRPIIEHINNQDLYLKISSSKNEHLTIQHNPSTIIMTQIPPSLEHYTDYILNSANKMNFNRHLAWLVQSLNIQKESISEAIMVDFIRYLLIAVNEHNFMNKKSDGVQKWLILGWLLKYIKSKYFLTMAKQALFFDWLFYDGDIREYRIFEPVWLMIIHSLNKYRDMSEELLEFLFLFSAE